jgi:hypothetical protein
VKNEIEKMGVGQSIPLWKYEELKKKLESRKELYRKHYRLVEDKVETDLVHIHEILVDMFKYFTDGQNSQEVAAQREEMLVDIHATFKWLLNTLELNEIFLKQGLNNLRGRSATQAVMDICIDIVFTWRFLFDYNQGSGANTANPAWRYYYDDEGHMFKKAVGSIDKIVDEMEDVLKKSYRSVRKTDSKDIERMEAALKTIEDQIIAGSGEARACVENWAIADQTTRKELETLIKHMVKFYSSLYTDDSRIVDVKYQFTGDGGTDIIVTIKKYAGPPRRPLPKRPATTKEVESSSSDSDGSSSDHE